VSCSIEREEEEGFGGAALRPAPGIRSIADGFGEIYPQLRSMASTLMRQERSSHTLQPTAVVSEAFLRLAHRDPSEFASSANLLAVASHAMRCVLVDHARSRAATKRGAARRTGDGALAFVQDERLRPEDIIAIDEALVELASVDERAARVLECKVFGGMTNPEIGDALGVSRPTVNRDWRFGRAFLAQKLGMELADLGEADERMAAGALTTAG
jgi:RNA polymerase sigma factor (TIGR02999 family)